MPDSLQPPNIPILPVSGQELFDSLMNKDQLEKDFPGAVTAYRQKFDATRDALEGSMRAANRTAGTYAEGLSRQHEDARHLQEIDDQIQQSSS